MKLTNPVIAGGLLVFLAQTAFADDTFILATGRRDPRIYAIDLKKALRPENNNTPNAKTARPRTSSTTTGPPTTPNSCSTAGAETSRS